MWYWFTMSLCNVLIPLIMILAGYMMEKHTPGKINHIIGYRTKRSMKNKDTWDFAHKLCGRLWWKAGWITIIPSGLIMVFLLHGNDKTISVATLFLEGIQIAVLFISILFVEKGLKENFDENGNKIE